MPLYEYQCKKCGHRFERIQSFSAEDVKECPVCQGEVERLISTPARAQFKGSGFYTTDYASPSSKSSDSGSGSSGSGSSGSGAASGTNASASGKSDTGSADKGSSTKSESTSAPAPSTSSSKSE